MRASHGVGRESRETTLNQKITRTAVGLTGLFFAQAIAFAPAGAEMRQPRTSDLVCSLSAFFSTDPADRFATHVRLDGRGLVSCRNDQGFSSEFPVVVDVEADVPEGLLKKPGEVSFSGNTAPFVVPREAGQLQDEYEIRPYGWNQKMDPTSPEVLFRGRRHDLVIQMKLTSQTSALAGLNVTKLRLHFDETAPDLF